MNILLKALLAAGYVVVAPDYEGLVNQVKKMLIHF
jgi:phosphomevalonate kinase